MYGEELVTLINAAVDSSKQKKREMDVSSNSQSKRFDSDDKENIQSPGLYALSPMHQSAPSFPDQQAFFQAFQDVFMPPSTQQMFPMNFPSFPQFSPPQQLTFNQANASIGCEELLESTPSPPQCVTSESETTKSAPVEIYQMRRRIVESSPPGLHPFDPSHVFDETTGRLCLLNASTKHKVTIGEIQRRLSPPETLHASLINGILRKAKTKNGCTTLRERLAERGFSLPNGRRKTAPTTLFTALCEKEALLLAHDFDTICQSTLNTFEIARRVNRNFYTLHEMNAASRVLMGILEAFEEVPEDPADYVDERIPAAYSINMLSLLTHGFGHNAIKTALRMALQVIEKQRAIIHGTPPSYVSYSQSPASRFM